MMTMILAALIAQDKPEVELPKADAEGWINLFNGKDLTGWDGDPAVWRVEEGCISGKAEKVAGNTFLVYNHKFSNFVLEAKWMLIKTGKFPNSGIQYRSKVSDWKKWIVKGYQADIGEGWSGTLYEEGGRQVLFKAKPEVAKAVKDDWNQYVITADGPKVKQELNGIVTGELDDADEKKRSLEGIIALQFHAPGGFEIKFKDVRIKLK